MSGMYLSRAIFVSNYTHIDHFLGILCIAFFLLKIERCTVCHVVAMRRSHLAENCVLLSTILLVFICEDLLL